MSRTTSISGLTVIVAMASATLAELVRVDRRLTVDRGVPALRQPRWSPLRDVRGD